MEIAGAFLGFVLLAAAAAGLVAWRLRRRHGGVPRGWQYDQSEAADLHRRMYRKIDALRREIAASAARGVDVSRIQDLVSDIDVEAKAVDARLVTASRLPGPAKRRSLLELRPRVIEVERLTDRVTELLAALEAPDAREIDGGLQRVRESLDTLDAARQETREIGPEGTPGTLEA
jgi:hypothetical protein